MLSKKEKIIRHREANSRYYHRNYQKYAAKVLALRSGIKQPKYCEVCGEKISFLHRHHYDYNKPLSFVWVCTKCHGFIHTYLNRVEELNELAK